MAKEISNPCISVCKFDSDVCIGCGRTKQEIRKWKGMTRPEKKDVVQQAAARLKSIRKKRDR